MGSEAKFMSICVVVVVVVVVVVGFKGVSIAELID